MGQVPAKQFAQPRPIGATQSPNDALLQSKAAPMLPQNAFQPLIQNMVPTVQTANAVPHNGVAGGNGYPNPYPDNIKDPYGVFGYDVFDPQRRMVL